MSEEVQWYSAGVQYRWNDEPTYETLVRTWSPGDGISCSASAHNKRIPCGAPVAVVRQVRVGEPRGAAPRSSITRVYCIRHLAKLFDVAPTADNEVERQALEELAQRYWDQYQEIRQRLADELLERRFAGLPNGLREQVVAATRESEDAA